MTYFKKTNNTVGWIVFTIATIVYVLTVEPTASFWDCSEFIATSYKLQVPHPPGAPFFLLVNRMFSFLAMGDVTQVAYWINISSALFSGFTILFLFWSITMLGAKLYKKELSALDKYEVRTLMGAGAIGALAYTFSDSFWFSAVEAEVYAMSSFFTALVFWAMLRWEQVEDPQTSQRWLIFIAYMIALSIGVHLLNLVTIPALGLIYYYKTQSKPTLKGIVITLVACGAILMLILEGVIPGLPSVAGSLEITFRNSFGLPFYTGLVVFSVLFLSLVVGLTIHSLKKKSVAYNTIMMAFCFILIGYTSYGIVLIRSGFNPPIDENDPENAISFVSYLKREQYGDRPLVTGHTFASEIESQEKGAPQYMKDDATGKYIIYNHKIINKYRDNMLFPRIHSRAGHHIKAYREILNLPGKKKPAFSDNISFLFNRQLSFFYLRYFMWNFSGRESDHQDAEALNPFSSTVGMPNELANNKARNQYFALPLLLGLLGLGFNYMKNKKAFFVVSMLFILTGIALIFYLNPPPTEPRERDYIYVGSFYAFAIWIGFGVMAIADFFKNKKLASIIAPAVCLVVPVIMLVQNWDDHDRSGRYHSTDSAKNLLNSCAPNAILFTGGDNDTFPLWYVQEVEGYRTDVRVCNLSLLGTDWYVSQMKKKAYLSDPLPISLNEPQYRQGFNDHLQFTPFRGSPGMSRSKIKQVGEGLAANGVDLNKWIDMVSKESEYIMVPYVAKPQSRMDYVTTFPSRIFKVKIDKEEVLKAGFVSKNMEDMIADEMKWDIKTDNLSKDKLIILDIIANNHWKRPIYFSTTLGPDSYLNLYEYFQQEGYAYRLMPMSLGIEQSGRTINFVNTDVMYKNMMLEHKSKIKGADGKVVAETTRKMHWRNLDNPKVFYDENYRRFALNARSCFSSLAQNLLMESQMVKRLKMQKLIEAGKEEEAKTLGKTYSDEKMVKAKKAVLRSLELMPNEALPYDIYCTQYVDVLLETGELKKAVEIANVMGKEAALTAQYMIDNRNIGYQLRQQLSTLSMLEGALKEKQPKEAKKWGDALGKIADQLEGYGL